LEANIAGAIKTMDLQIDPGGDLDVYCPPCCFWGATTGVSAAGWFRSGLSASRSIRGETNQEGQRGPLFLFQIKNLLFKQAF